MVSHHGNIQSKVDAGVYDYHTTKLHAVNKINNPSSFISSEPQVITYNSFNKVSTITEGQYELQILYGSDKYRNKTVLKQNGSDINTRIFAGNYEKEILEDGTVKEYHYINGPAGLIAVYIKVNGNGTLYYTVTDHLGSILQILGQNGNLIEETNYDPWGRSRNPNTLVYDNAAGLNTVYRGYTGHEMLPHFALINMNGRMYDPVLGRMLSPDNFVQSPNNPQNYNRYAYCLN
ncbi:MAG: hypothetical protein HY738_17950, partial [Bacteroidia bacterium]|nr:hypothetical protein [Bacteroidia bacterium]